MCQDAIWQAQQFHISPAGIEILCNTRSGTAEDQIGIAQFCQGFRCLHSMVKRLAFRLVVRVMITFINHNQPEVGQGHKQCAAGADDQLQVTAAGSAPGVVAFTIREFGVIETHLVGKACHEAPDCLGGHGNFRHHHQRLASLRQHLRGCPQVNLSLAGTGHAMQ